MIHYDKKCFRPVQNTENGESSADTVFNYRQSGNILHAEYKGGKILYGHLIGIVDTEGCIEMRYHQINDQQEIMTGVCQSRPEILPSGKIRLHEKWQWTSGDFSCGESIIEEM